MLQHETARVAEARQALELQQQLVAAAEEALEPLQARWFNYVFPEEEASASLKANRRAALDAVAAAKEPLRRLELALQDAERALRETRGLEADRAWLARTEADCLEAVTDAAERLAVAQRQHDSLKQAVADARQRLADARLAMEAVTDATERLAGLRSQRSAILGEAYAAGKPTPDTGELEDAIGDAEMHLDSLTREAEAASAAMPLLEEALQGAMLALEDSPLASGKAAHALAVAELLERRIRRKGAELTALRDELAAVDRSAAYALTSAWKTGLLVPGPHGLQPAPGL